VGRYRQLPLFAHAAARLVAAAPTLRCSATTQVNHNQAPLNQPAAGAARRNVSSSVVEESACFAAAAAAAVAQPLKRRQTLAPRVPRTRRRPQPLPKLQRQSRAFFQARRSTAPPHPGYGRGEGVKVCAEKGRKEEGEQRREGML